MNTNANISASRLSAMVPISETESQLIGIALVVVLFLLLLALTVFIHNFSKELHYLNMEIERTQGEERGYYLHQRRRLWLSLIPFVRY